MKRFWTEASVAADADGHRVLLDGKPLRLPGGAVLCVPSRGLAEAVAGEWAAAGGGDVGGAVSYDQTGLTRLAGTAQLRIVPDPDPVVAALAAYGQTDLLCYRAEAPLALIEREAAAWDPWLDWAAGMYGARLAVTSGIVHRAQEPEALAALAAAVARIDPWRLAGLGVAVPALGSLVLGLALAEGAVAAAEAHGLAMLDETFQAEAWGEDDEAVARRAAVGRDVAEAARFMALAGSQAP